MEDLSAQHVIKKCLACGIKSHFKNSIICQQREDSNYAASVDEDLGGIYLGSVDNNEKLSHLNQYHGK